MAIQVSELQLDNGLTVQNTYSRIEMTSGSKESQTFSLNHYISQEACESGKDFVKQDVLSCEVSVADDAPNFIKQEYEHVKSLSQFEGATDC